MRFGQVSCDGLPDKLEIAVAPVLVRDRSATALTQVGSDPIEDWPRHATRGEIMQSVLEIDARNGISDRHRGAFARPMISVDARTCDARNPVHSRGFGRGGRTMLVL